MRRSHNGARGKGDIIAIRLRIVQTVFFVFALLVIVRLFYLQVVKSSEYKAMASDLRDVQRVVEAQRGVIWVHDDIGKGENQLFPIVRNVNLNLVYAVPKNITDAEASAGALGPLLGIPHDTLLAKLSKQDDPYEPLMHRISGETREAVEALSLPGIGFQTEYAREYPEGLTFSALTGFMQGDGEERRGQYGLEQGYEEELRGIDGLFDVERDGRGNVIPVGRQIWDDPVNGSDLVLTIDHAIQYRACNKLEAAVQQHEAKGGALIVMDPLTGALRALCSSPRYDPNNYGAVKDMSVFSNKAVSDAWEPGSIFKAITMAGALDFEAVAPDTRFVDTGSLTIDKETIRNADNKVYGEQSMTQVLAQSINTGAVFAQQKIGKERFKEIVERFGFGTRYGTGLPGEHTGNISSLEHAGDIYAATAAFGQGITATPLQMAAAFGAIANGGVLMQPYLVEEIRRPDGATARTQAKELRRVLTLKTATLLRAMLVTVVEEGHGKRAGVKGFWVAGKTGTAQVAARGRRGYDPGKTIGSFVGFGPAASPRFVILVRIDEPKTVKFAESTAAPLFGEIADFLFEYYRIQPEREVKP
jgi:cell division protein FtsI/penicillin-binding protein 2